LLSAYVRKAEEGELGRLLVEMVILRSAQTQDSGKALQDAVAVYKVDNNAIVAKANRSLRRRRKRKR
jgi:ParB family transcriptional regulator, chromosome partitioning protein